MTASLATYPHEVLRTRLQIYRSQRSKSAVTTPARLVRQAPPGQEALAYSRGASSTAHPSAAEGMIATFTAILKQDGWKGFYRGLSINLIRTVPNSAVTMLTFVSPLRS